MTRLQFKSVKMSAKLKQHKIAVQLNATLYLQFNSVQKSSLYFFRAWKGLHDRGVSSALIKTWRLKA